ncbi:MAG: hypothetical protein LBI63_00290 [Candidatus Ancillula sp.]|jgi:hypothetical protein|nr:hypothetical protein [Candidatus Ancillula sp.]
MKRRDLERFVAFSTLLSFFTFCAIVTGNLIEKAAILFGILLAAVLMQKMWENQRKRRKAKKKLSKTTT